MGKNKNMRQVFADYLKEEMTRNKDLVVIDADLAMASGTHSLRKDFPDRALDVGVAEQNMASVAAGLASYGFIPYISSFGVFASRRICDQIMISIAYAKQNVKIVGTDPGITAQYNGGTHMPFEDIGVLRSIPNLVIYEASDCREFEAILPQITAYNGPVYIRMVRKISLNAYNRNKKEFDLFKAEIAKQGKDVSVIASGIMAEIAMQAAKELEKEGISCEVIVNHTIKPLDEKTLLKSIKKTKCVVTCENHNIIGGLNSAISELIARDMPTKIYAVGIKDEFGEVGTLEYLKERYKLNVCDVKEMIKKAIKEKK